MIKKTGIISALLLILLPTILWADRGYITAHVTRILVSDNGTWGGCMAFLDKVIATQSNIALNCPSRWITFSCDGTYNSKDIAYRKLDLAQKSEVTGHRVKAYIDDRKKHNGYCYAWRLDSLNK
jgi:hypothetical protein